jgi:hypothetical protein
MQVCGPRSAQLGLAGALVVLVALVLSGRACSDPLSAVKYDLFRWEDPDWVEYVPSDPFPPDGDQPGTNLWRYEYILYNWGTPQPIQQLYVLFNSENVSMDATWAGAAAPEGWTATLVGPFDPDFNWKERFRASSSSYYVQEGDSLEGFGVEFTWTRHYLPGSQAYDAVFSGGSESGLTVHRTQPVSTAPCSWGRVKSLYR